MDLWKTAPTNPDVAYELRTANLIAVHTTSSLREQLNLADQYELEKTILRRLGLKDA